MYAQSNLMPRSVKQEDCQLIPAVKSIYYDNNSLQKLMHESNLWHIQVYTVLFKNSFIQR